MARSTTTEVTTLSSYHNTYLFRMCAITHRYGGLQSTINVQYIHILAQNKNIHTLYET